MLLPENPEDGGKKERRVRFFFALLVKVFTPLLVRAMCQSLSSVVGVLVVYLIQRFSFGTQQEQGLTHVLYISLIQGLFNAIIYFRRRFADLIKDGKSLAFVKRLPMIREWIQNNRSQRSDSNTMSSDSRPRPPPQQEQQEQPVQEDDGARLQENSSPVAISDPVHTTTGCENGGTASVNVAADDPRGDDVLATCNERQCTSS